MNRIIATYLCHKRSVQYILIMLACIVFAIRSPQSAVGSGEAQEMPTDEPVTDTGLSLSENQDFALYLPVVGNSPVLFGYGIQAHMVTRSQAERSLVTTLYLDFEWAKQQIARQLYYYRWTGGIAYGVMDQLVIIGMRNEINLLFSVVDLPSLAIESDNIQTMEAPLIDSEAYAEFVGRIARRYCGTSLKAIEVWNEQNLQAEWGSQPNPEKYIALLALAYQSIKTECPSMTVISGGLAQTGDNPPMAMDDFTYLEQMLQAGLLDHVDGVGVHALGYNVPPWVPWTEACDAIQASGNTFNGPCDTPHHSWSFRSTLEGYRERIVASGGASIPLWVTEFGWAAGGAYEAGYEYADDNDYTEQADWTVYAFNMMRDSGWVEAAFLWNLNLRILADQTQKAQWGIVEPPDWHPLPVFRAISRLNKTDRNRPTLEELAALKTTEEVAETRAQTAPVHVPEPISLVLMATGLVSLAGYVRRRRRQQ